MTTPIVDTESLLGQLLPRARATVEKAGALTPLAAMIDAAGGFAWLAAPDVPQGAGTGAVVDLYKAAIAESVRKSNGRAAALAYVTQVNLAADDAVCDAIVLSIAHRDGYSVDLFHPFRSSNGAVVWGEAFARESLADLFGAAA